MRLFFAFLATLMFSWNAYAADANIAPPVELKKPEGATLLVKHYQPMAQKNLKLDAKPVGQVFTYLYHVPFVTVPAELIKTYEADLAPLGFKKIGSDHTISHISGYCNELKGACGKAGDFVFGFDAGKSAVFQKQVPEGDTYIAVYAKAAEKPVQWSKESSASAQVAAITYNPGDIMQMVMIVAPKQSAVKLVKEDANFITQGLRDNGRVDLYGILFDFNKADIKPESQPVIDQVASVLKADPALKLGVVGHTDAVGTKEYNDTLSLARAKSVALALAAQGVDSARLTPEGKGFAEPKAANDTEENRAKNRRVELVKR